MKKTQCQPKLSVSQPPTVGPTTGPTVAVIPKRARPNGCLLFGSVDNATVRAIGIITPPVKPWPARKQIISLRLRAIPQRQEKSTNSPTLPTMYHLNVNTRGSHPVIGLFTTPPPKY